MEGEMVKRKSTYWNQGYGYQQGYGPGYGGSDDSPHGYYGYGPDYYYRKKHGENSQVCERDKMGCQKPETSVVQKLKEQCAERSRCDTSTKKSSFMNCQGDQGQGTV
ncbi:Mucin-21 [Manis pentadactyla]|nr:Mucin-21 [Manis pentadactyla]